MSRLGIFRAVITVGFQRYHDILQSGWRNIFFRFGMGMSVLSFLELRGNDLCISEGYGQLDRSEKGAATYWYGMAFTKLVAENELSIPWLIHADLLRKSGVLTSFSASKELGDLVGRGRDGDWHVLEAKGRSNPYFQKLIEKAKRQAARVITINGQPPNTMSACITSISTQPITVLLDDPLADDEGDGEHWRIVEDNFFQQYYRGIIEYLGEYSPHREQTINNAVYLTAPLFPFFNELFYSLPQSRFDKWPLEIGLLTGIYKHPEHAPSAVKDLKNNDSGRIGSDGIAILGASQIGRSFDVG